MKWILEDSDPTETVEVKLGNELICSSHFLLYWRPESAVLLEEWNPTIKERPLKQHE